MPNITLMPNHPWEHMKVAPGAWFYMNHMKEQPPAAAHDHNFLELAFIVGGSARHVTVRGTEPCRAGEVFILPIGTWHAYVDCRGLELYNCLLSPAMLQKELAWLAEDVRFGGLFGLTSLSLFSGPHKLTLSQAQWQPVRERLEQLAQVYQGTGSRLGVLGCLLLLLDALRPCVSAPAESPQPMHPAVRKSLAFLHQDFVRTWTLRELAAKVYLSPPYLVRLFRAATGRAPMHYLDALRAEQAAMLLFSTSLRIGEIAERVGWPEPKHFSRAFRRHFGMSASHYRDRLKRALPAAGSTVSQ